MRPGVLCRPYRAQGLPLPQPRAAALGWEFLPFRQSQGNPQRAGVLQPGLSLNRPLRS
jgi:hypothetical protein